MAIIAEFKNGDTKVYTKSAYQFDKGQKLMISGIDLPDSFEVHASNDRYGDMSINCEDVTEGINIPDVLFTSGNFVYVWIYATQDDDTGKTVCEIVIPVIKRPGMILSGIYADYEGPFVS